MFRKLFFYLKSHLWYTISLTVGFMIVCMYLGYQQYMQYKYTGFLLEKNHLMESAVLETMYSNLDYSLDEYIELGAKIAVNPQIYGLAEEIFFSEYDDVKTKGIRDLMNHFSATATLSSNVLNISLVSEDGQVFQYDRLIKGKTTMWNNSNKKILDDMYGKLYEKANGIQVPRYLVTTNPSSHPTNKEQVFHIFYPMVGKNSNFSHMNSMLCITYKMDILKPFMDTIAESGSDYTKGYITDESDIMIHHTDFEYIGKKESEYLSSSDSLLWIKTWRRPDGSCISRWIKTS